MKEKIKIWYVDFWGEFKIENPNNYFTKLLSTKYDVEITPHNPNLLFYSVFGEEYKKWKHTKKIFFTGENKNPYGDYSLAFSFNYDESENEIRLPLYSMFSYEEESYKQLISEKIYIPRNNFCSFMVGNLTHGTGSQLRVEFFKKLNEYKEVFSSGRSLRNRNYDYLIDAHGVDDWRKMKFKILDIEKTKFMISFENEKHIGYTTEKIMDAMISGIIPIYWGNPNIACDFNFNSFVFANNFKSFNELKEYIIYLDQNENEYKKMYLQPWIDMDEHFSYFNHQKILNKLTELIEHKSNFSMRTNLIRPNHFFDDIYCLNLKRRYDRWITNKKRFQRENIYVTRIEGIDKLENNIEYLFNKGKREKKYLHLNNSGSLAILESFKKILEMAIQANHEKILIFEDDVTFHTDFKYLFDEQIRNLPKNWDIWYLGGTQQSLPNNYQKNIINKHFYRPLMMDGCFAIAINKSMFKYLLNLINQYDYPLDSAIKENIQPTNEFMVIASEIFLCGHDYGISDNWDMDFNLDTTKNIWKNRFYDPKIYK